MGGQKTRVVEGVGEDVRTLVDHGHEVNTNLKNVQHKDDAVKSQIGQKADPLFDTDESSVRVQGHESEATIARSEKYSVNADGDTIRKIREASEQGLLGEAVKVQPKLTVPAEQREQAQRILQEAGIDASVQKEVSVNPDGYRDLANSQSLSEEAAEAKAELDEVAEKTVSHRVQYRTIQHQKQ